MDSINLSLTRGSLLKDTRVFPILVLNLARLDELD